MNSENVFVGRQPILDMNENIFGYELLYRNSENNFFPGINPEEATIELLVNTFFSIGVDRIVEKGMSFINFTARLLAQDIFHNLDPKRVVIEILEDVEITPSLLSRMRELKDEGFTLALDDFILDDHVQHITQLFPLINYIKVDFLASSVSDLEKIKKLLITYPHIRLLAEKVETEQQFNLAKKAGYTLFQGYFFAKPEIIKGHEIPSNATLHFQIINRMNEDSPNINNIAELIMRDVSLSYKLLRFINSPGIGVPIKISSIKQAIVLIGLKEMKKWMHVLALRELRDENAPGSIKVLVDYSLTRAKMCELLAKQMGKVNADEYFLAGMFSLLDVIMKRDWADILPLIPLSDEVDKTLRGMTTEITPFIEIAVAVERFDFNRLEPLAKELGIPYDELCKSCLEANRWLQNLD